MSLPLVPSTRFIDGVPLYIHYECTHSLADYKTAIDQYQDAQGRHSNQFILAELRPDHLVVGVADSESLPSCSSSRQYIPTTMTRHGASAATCGYVSSPSFNEQSTGSDDLPSDRLDHNLLGAHEHFETLKHPYRLIMMLTHLATDLR